MARNKRKGVIALFFVFVIVGTILLVLFAFAIPMMMAMNVGLYAAGDNIIGNIDVSQINDVGIRTAINNSLNTASQSTADNVSILSSFFQYSWFIVIAILSLMLFLKSREMVETNAGGIR